jgi:hypothetical protein
MDINDSVIKMLDDHVNDASIIYQEIPSNFQSLDDISDFIPTVNRQLFLFVSTGFFEPSRTVENYNKCIENATIYLHNFIKSVSYSTKLNFNNDYTLDFLVKCRKIHGNIEQFILGFLEYDVTIEEFLTDTGDSYETILDKSLNLLDLKLKVLIRGVELNNPPFNIDEYNKSLLETSNAVRMSGIFNEYTQIDGEVIYILPDIQPGIQSLEPVEETKGKEPEEGGENSEDEEEEGVVVEPDVTEINQNVIREIEELPINSLSEDTISSELLEAIKNCFEDQPSYK